MPPPHSFSEFCWIVQHASWIEYCSHFRPETEPHEHWALSSSKWWQKQQPKSSWHYLCASAVTIEIECLLYKWKTNMKRAITLGLRLSHPTTFRCNVNTQSCCICVLVFRVAIFVWEKYDLCIAITTAISLKSDWATTFFRWFLLSRPSSNEFLFFSSVALDFNSFWRK